MAKHLPPPKPAARHELTKRVRTPDDWHPTPPDRCVKVRLVQLGSDQWRVSVWGGDDFGLELDFAPDKEQEARFTYDIIDVQITIQELLDLGFQYA